MQANAAKKIIEITGRTWTDPMDTMPVTFELFELDGKLNVEFHVCGHYRQRHVIEGEDLDDIIERFEPEARGYRFGIYGPILEAIKFIVKLAKDNKVADPVYF